MAQLLRGGETVNGTADMDTDEAKQRFTVRPDSLDTLNEGSEYRQMLLRNVKKEVKQIMEEAVTRKLIHEESSSITSLCGAVEACLRYGLRRRALGLFREGSTTALLQKIVRECDAAAAVLERLVEEQPLGGGSAPLLAGSSSLNSAQTSVGHRNGNDSKRPFDSRSSLRPRPSHQAKYLWIRIALLEKELAKIVEFLVENAQRFYEKESIMADLCDGPLLASLLVGPCALDYTRMKTCDHLWTDPSADELVQRHRIHSSTAHYCPNSPRKPSLMIRRHTSSSSEESLRSAPPSAKEYVESLHQNTKSTLIYGKNNVLVHPREDTEALPGYLSLHHDIGGLTLKWTPNQLMNGCHGEATTEESAPIDKSLYWDYALTIPIDEVVYVHCHQKTSIGGMVVLVGQDGVQRPPLHFPPGGHLLAFLSCLENGLQPSGRLDPPLWSQRGKGPNFSPAGKVLPKLKRRSTNKKRARPPVSETDRTRSMEDPRTRQQKEDEEEEEETEEPTDYVFRIVFENQSAVSTTKFTVGDENPGTHFPWNSPGTIIQERFSNGMDATLQNRTSIKQLCDTMRKQILSRAFYGWLAYCRHLRTVRTHLSGLVKIEIPEIRSEYCESLSPERWEKVKAGTVPPSEVYRSVYFAGCHPSIRQDLWPYLLGHYTWTQLPEERVALDVACRTHYEQTMSEWLAVEAIVRQQQKEAQEECQRAVIERERKLEANEAGNAENGETATREGEIPLCRQPSFDNDVFEERKGGEFLWQLIAKLKRQWSSQTDLTTGGRSGEDNDGVEDVDDEGFEGENHNDRPSSSSTADLSLPPSGPSEPQEKRIHTVHPSVDSGNASEVTGGTPGPISALPGEDKKMLSSLAVHDDDKDETASRLSTSHESLMSPASPASHGGVYSKKLLSEMSLNLHRIEKDVARCDRNYPFFNLDNLDKLRNVMCTYVWEHLDVGYVQGMCDLLAPLLVILEDESLTHACFTRLMERMTLNFPHGGAMDTHFANMRSLIQILDPELFEHMHKNGDYTHFYFCYRWFLLDFKREFVYEDVFAVWETIWAAMAVSSSHFGLFLALAMVKVYREIIIDNNMDFTDIIKFFNEMAERHDVKVVLRLARDLVHQLQELIENK